MQKLRIGDIVKYGGVEGRVERIEENAKGEQVNIIIWLFEKKCSTYSSPAYHLFEVVQKGTSHE